MTKQQLEQLDSKDRDSYITDFLTRYCIPFKYTAAGQFKILSMRYSGVMFYPSSLKIMVQREGKPNAVKEFESLGEVLIVLQRCVNNATA